MIFLIRSQGWLYLMSPSVTGEDFGGRRAGEQKHGGHLVSVHVKNCNYIAGVFGGISLPYTSEDVAGEEMVNGVNNCILYQLVT